MSTASSKEVIPPPAKPLERVAFTVTTAAVNPDRWFFQKSEMRVSNTKTTRGDSDIDILHKLYDDAKRCPIEAFCFVIWSTNASIESLVKAVTNEEFLILLDQLCPRHHYSRLATLDESYFCTRAKKHSAGFPKYEVETECWVVSLLRSVAQLNGTWKEMSDSPEEKRVGLLRPRPDQFTNKCKEEEVQPVCQFLTKVHSYYCTIADAKRAEKAVKERKRQLEKQQEAASSAKIQTLESAENADRPAVLTNGHHKISGQDHVNGAVDTEGQQAKQS